MPGGRSGLLLKNFTYLFSYLEQQEKDKQKETEMTESISFLMNTGSFLIGCSIPSCCSPQRVTQHDYESYFQRRNALTLELLPGGHNPPSPALASSMFHQVAEWQQYISLESNRCNLLESINIFAGINLKSLRKSLFYPVSCGLALTANMTQKSK